MKKIRFILLTILFLPSFSGLRAQSCLCNNYGPELIYNGNFSLGNVGFTTQYIYSSTIAGSGKYGITPTPWTANTFWSHCTDHTTGTGNLMWIDCAVNTSLTIWSQTVTGLSLNTDYLFSCWVVTLDVNGPAVLQFNINGQQIDTPFTAPSATCNWVRFCYVWNSGSSTSATISIVNQSQFGVGNDVAIDDISLVACCHAINNDVVASICNGDSYQLPGGTIVSAAGTYNDTLNTFVGCDSVITTHLSVLSTSSFSQNISICSGQSFYAGGAFQTTGGTYIDHLINYLGCDSVLTTNLTVLPNSSATISASICNGDAYFAGGGLQTVSGVYVDTLINYVGCDSVLTTNLTVFPNSFHLQNISICDGQSYFAGGALQTSSGAYFDTLTNYLGCDSVIATSLTVLLNTSHAVNVSICNGQSYFAGGALQTVSGMYLDTFTNYLGCDSVLTTNLTVLANSAFTQNISICDGQSFFAGGALQTTSGIYVDNLVNSVGCDSTLTTNLTVLPNSVHTINPSICQGQSYFAGGALQTTGGTYIDTLMNFLGCDSVLTTNLTVLPTSSFLKNISICNGQSYFAGGGLQTNSGTYFDTLVNYVGCDSVITTNLSVLINTAFTVNTTICNGQSYFAGGAFQTTSGTYLDTFVNYIGCDSILTTHLTVLANSAFTQNISICDGQSFFAGGGLQTMSGTYIDTLINSVGCDSVLTTNLTVLPNSSNTINASICQGQSYFAGGAFQITSGIYQDTLLNFVGCDSVLTTNLTVLPTSSLTQNVSICNGQSYFVGGALQTTSGTYFDTLTNYLGCDSVITTNLTVLVNTSYTINVSICDGQSYFAGGGLQTTSGIYFDSLINFIGCDSLLTTNLTVLPNSSFTQNISICAGQTFFAGGALQTTSGTYLDTLINSVGCDSVLTTNLTVLPNSSLLVNASICDGQSYFAGGVFQTISGIYKDTLVNYLGCDSVITTNLTVLPNTALTQNISICNGDSYFAGGALQTTSGTYFDTLVNYLGCDSVITTNLTVLVNTAYTVNISICDGQSYFAGGSLQTTSGVYFDSLTNSIGCDSLLTTNLTVLSNSASTQNASICDGQSYYAGGALQTQSGIYFDTLVNSVGCDSVITTNLTVLPNSSFTENISICFGDSIFVGGGWQTQNGSYVDHYTNYLGCDSTLTTVLQVYPLITVQVNPVICYGQTYYAGGMNQSQSGFYVDTFAAVTGCDSIVTTNLTALSPISTSLSPVICNDQQYYAGGNWQNTTGIYFDTLSSYMGCDSVVITNLTVKPAPVIDLGNDTSFCQGASVLLDAGSGFQSYLWQDQSYESFFVAGHEGIYWVTITNSFGCTASDTVYVMNVFPLPNNFLPADTFICGNRPINLSVDGFQFYLWNNGDTKSTSTITKEGTYWLTVTDDHGCSGRDSIVIYDGCNDDILVPNAFTPNGDGRNDIFLPILVKNISEYRMTIFNRWGIKVFETIHPSFGWDGSDNGLPAEIGAFMWSIDYTLEDGAKKNIKGNVTLLR